MKTSTTVVIAVILAILIAVGAWFFFARPAGTDTGGQNTGNPFPSGGNVNPGTGGGQASVTVTANDGGAPIATRDFKSDPGVIKNPYHTDDYYILVGTDDPLAETPPYEIDYSSKDQSFGITLNREPLGGYRLQAEQDLMQRLAISKEDMCRLNYVLAVGSGVNDAYRGKNLEFSFCTNATPLPQ